MLHLAYEFETETPLDDLAETITVEVPPFSLTVEPRVHSVTRGRELAHVTVSAAIELDLDEAAYIDEMIALRVPAGADTAVWSGEIRFLGEDPTVAVGDPIPPNVLLSRDCLPRALSKKLDDLQAAASRESERALRVLRWRLERSFHSRLALTISGSRWSTDGVTWGRLPGMGIRVGNAFVVHPITPEHIADAIQRIQHGDDEPIGTTILLEASDSSRSPRAALILAFTAAEVAVKAYLSERFPDLDQLLMTMPSPPLYRIVKEVLPNVRRGREPIPTALLTQLNRAAEARNAVAHRGEAAENLYQTMAAASQLIRILEEDDFPRTHPRRESLAVS